MEKINIDPSEGNGENPNDKVIAPINEPPFTKYVAEKAEDRKLVARIHNLEVENEKGGPNKLIVATLGCKTAPSVPRFDNSSFRKTVYALFDYDKHINESAQEYLKHFAAIEYEAKSDFNEKREEYNTILYMAKLMPKLEIGCAIDDANETPNLRNELFSEVIFVPKINNSTNEAIPRPGSEKQVVRYLDSIYRRDLSSSLEGSDEYKAECSQKIAILSEYFRGNSFESQILKTARELGEMTRPKNGRLLIVDDNNNLNDTGKRMISLAKGIAYCQELQREVSASRSTYEDFLEFYRCGQQFMNKMSRDD